MPPHVIRRCPFSLRLVVASYLLFYPLVAIWAWFAPESLRNDAIGVLFWALTNSFLSLLGIWAGLGADTWWKRWGGALVGLMYVVSMAGFEFWLENNRNLAAPIVLRETLRYLGSFSLTLVGVGGLLAIERCSAAGLRLLDRKDERASDGGFQFSIRSLLGIILAVAVLLGIAESYRSHRFRSVLALLVIINLSAIVIALASVWATLRHGRPLPRIIAVVLVAVCLGLISEYVMPKRNAYWPAIGVIQALGVSGPLLLLRSQGYRLAHRSVSSPASPEL